MSYNQSRQLKGKNTHLFLGVIFIVFIFTQFISIHHQVQHLNDYNDIACVQCMTLPDQLDDSLVDFSIFHPQETTTYKISHATEFVPLILKTYSARAPPFIA